MLRLIYQNLSYAYESRDGAGIIDPGFSHTYRNLLGYFGSHSRWGAFTLASGILIGADLNKYERCYANGDPFGQPTATNCNDWEIVVGRGSASEAPAIANAASGFYPVVIDFRLSLGVTID